MNKPNQPKHVDDKSMMEKFDNRPMARVINTICGGTLAPDSFPQEEDHPSKEVWTESSIIFSTEELNESHTLCDDPIVVLLIVAKYDVHHILIDNESSPISYFMMLL